MIVLRLPSPMEEWAVPGKGCWVHAQIISISLGMGEGLKGKRASRRKKWGRKGRKKKGREGISGMVQWLRIRLPMHPWSRKIPCAGGPQEKPPNDKLKRCKEGLPTLTATRESLHSAILNRASLVVQWLRICLALQRTLVGPLVQEDPTGQGATKPLHSFTEPAH